MEWFEKIKQKIKKFPVSGSRKKRAYHLAFIAVIILSVAFPLLLVNELFEDHYLPNAKIQTGSPDQEFNATSGRAQIVLNDFDEETGIIQGTFFIGITNLSGSYMVFNNQEVVLQTPDPDNLPDFKQGKANITVRYSQDNSKFRSYPSHYFMFNVYIQFILESVFIYELDLLSNIHHSAMKP